jgi:hypothetical protein
VEKVSAAPNKEIIVSPMSNPVKEKIVLLVQAVSERTVNVQVAGVNGNVVYTKQLRLQAGETNITIPVRDLPAGVLFVTIADKKDKQVIRIMKY